MVLVKNQCYIQIKIIRYYNKKYHKLCYNEQAYKEKNVVVYFYLVENLPFKTTKTKDE